MYQKLVKKLIYLSYDIKPNITFVIEQLNRNKANLRKDHF